MIRRRFRTVAHLAVLSSLVAGAGYGVVALAGYPAMLAGAAAGRMPLGGLDAEEIAFGVLQALLGGGAVVVGLGSLIRQSWRSLALARWVDRWSASPMPRLVWAAAIAHCPGRVVTVPSGRPFAFTQGLWTPRVVVSSGLVEQTDDEELVAVLGHEASHVRHRDPLKILALRSWASAFVFLPVVRALMRGILARQELRADRSAAALCGVSPMAGALLKAGGVPAMGAGSAVAAMGPPSMLEARIVQLETGEVPGLARAVQAGMVSSLPGVALVGVYGVLLYRVCLTARVCCEMGMI